MLRPIVLHCSRHPPWLTYCLPDLVPDPSRGPSALRVPGLAPATPRYPADCTARAGLHLPVGVAAAASDARLPGLSLEDGLSSGLTSDRVHLPLGATVSGGRVARAAGPTVA